MWRGTDILNIIEEYDIQIGSSFYAYDISQITQKVKQVQNVFEGWKILYSMKANPNISILQEVLANDVGIDAASCSEVLLARKYGCSPSNIYYSAPGKTIDNLQQCYDQCIIIADSINEIKRLANLAKQKRKPIRVGIRVNIPNNEIRGKAFEVMSGIPSKFGISPDDLECLKKICIDGFVEVIGLHVYFGSQIMDENIITTNLIKIANFALNLISDFPLQFINFGGGFGIPYRDTESSLNIANIANNAGFKKIIDVIWKQGIQCNLELGRYLVAESGVFCCTVEDIKKSFGKKYIILSSGINAFFRPVFTKEFHQISKCKVTDEETESVTIVGNLCTPIDQYYDEYQIEKLEIGDWLWFHNAGAYGLSMSMLDFISKERPLEIII